MTRSRLHAFRQRTVALTLGAAVPALLMAGPALAAAAEGGEGGGEKPSLFATKPFEYVWNLLMVTILVTVLWKLVWPKILAGLQAREEKQIGDLKAAETAKAEAESTLAEYKTQLAEAQKQAVAVINKAREDAEALASQRAKQAENDIAAMKQQAQAEIQSAQQQAMSGIYAQAAELSTTIAAKILQREINADDQRQLVEASLNELGQVNQN